MFLIAWPVEVMAAATHPALDKTLNFTLNAAAPVPCLPLLLGLGVDQRISSFKSFRNVLHESLRASCRDAIGPYN